VVTPVKTLNEVYSSLSTRRRYEVWFVRVGLAEGDGAWWFRYLLTNPGRGGCAGNPRGMPVQVWATWFPRDGKPQSFIQGFAMRELELSAGGENPFRMKIGNNEIGQNWCRGALQVDGHKIEWDMQYRSTFCVTLSNKGWIGFSRSPHSDAVFSGHISFDGREFRAEPLGFGVQGHNCGYRHRGFWSWAHAYLARPQGPASTLEALFYDMPLGLVFRKAVLWHEGKKHVFRKVRQVERDAGQLRWSFSAEHDGLRLDAAFDGSGAGRHRLPYVKTDCSGSFDVINNSLAKASVRLERGGAVEELNTTSGAVLEMAGKLAGG